MASSVAASPCPAIIVSIDELLRKRARESPVSRRGMSVATLIAQLAERLERDAIFSRARRAGGIGA